MDYDDDELNPVEHEMAISGLMVRLNTAMAKRRVSYETKLYKRHRINGIVYTSSNLHVGNSLIEYRRSKSSPVLDVGEIEYILRDSGDLKLIVRPQKPLPPGTDDPFLDFQDFPGRLYSSDLGESVLIDADQIVSHVARFVEKGSTEAVIVSLCRF